MSNGLSEELAEFVAKWWASKLKECNLGPYLETVVEQSPNAAISSLLRYCSKTPMPDTSVECFEEKLKGLILQGPDAATHLFGCMAWPQEFNLVVDYDPQGLLARALEIADITRHTHYRGRLRCA
jgi:hypothetical protein